MVKVLVREDSEGRIWSLHCAGHAGFDEHGMDIVCAAVSALTGALGLGFSQELSLPVELRAADGEFSLQLPREAAEQVQWASAQVLLRTVVAALREMAQYYAGFIVVEAG